MLLSGLEDYLRIEISCAARGQVRLARCLILLSITRETARGDSRHWTGRLANAKQVQALPLSAGIASCG